MVTCLKVRKSSAEAVRQTLLSLKVWSGKFKISREGDFVLFPLASESVEQVRKLRLGELENLPLAPIPSHPNSLYEALEGKLSQGDLSSLITSFDIVGDIAVLEIPPELEGKEKLIADAVLDVHRNIRTVAKKTGATGGQFRIRPILPIAGEMRTDTYYRESGCIFHLDINKVYFSGRLSTERLRVASLVKKGENILALFAGVGPFPIVAERHSKGKIAKQVAIELNPDAVKFLRENILLNKCKTIEPLEGDAGEILIQKRFLGWADRCFMPLPKSGEEFLRFVFPCMKNGGIVHFYTFGEDKNPFEGAQAAAEREANRAGISVRTVAKRIVRPYSPGLVQVVLDLEVKRAPLRKKSQEKKVR